MKTSDIFSSRYVGQKDIGKGTLRAVIDDVRLEEVKGNHGMEDKAIIYFKGDNPKPLILNTTNCSAIEDSYGEETDSWRGQPIELYIDPGVVYGGKRTGGVRVRVPSSGGVKRAASGGGNDSTWSWAEAQQYAAEAGIDTDALKAALKDMGCTAYNHQRDTAKVKQLINDATGASDGGAEPDDESIPF